MTNRAEPKLKFVGLHAHSVYSIFDGLGYPDEHADYAYENGMDALALTDHGSMNGLAHQVLHAKKMQAEGKDFKPIFGVEAYFNPSLKEWHEEKERTGKEKKGRKKKEEEISGTTIENEEESKQASKNILNRRRHLILLAQNETGLKNLFKLISDSYDEYAFYRFPRMDYEMLAKHSEGVIAASACMGGVYAGDFWENRENGSEAVLEAMRETTRRMLAIFGDRWYGELQWNKFPEQHQINKYVIQMSEEFGFKLISTADSHYPRPEKWKDRTLYKRIGWSGKGGSVSDLPDSVDEIGYELYPKNGDQMWEAYKKYSAEAGEEYNDELVRESIEETYKIAHERIENFFPDNSVRLPGFVVPSGKTAEETLIEEANAGLKRSKHWRRNDYKERLAHELRVINKNDFAAYFLTMKAIADISSSRQLVGPGRGSAAGSLVAYALGITQIDPIKFDLQFERFMAENQAEIGYPDIDYDVANPMEIKEVLIEEWGKRNVIPITNYTTLQLKSLIKDIAKYYQIPFQEVNKVTGKMMFEATAAAKKAHGITAGVYTPTFEEVMQYSESLQEFLQKYPHIATHVNSIYGSVRSVSRHAGGVVIAENLDEQMPLINSKGVRQTPWSEGQNVRHLEPMGFIKFDILGLSTLEMMDTCIRHILKRHHDIKEPTFDDVKEYYDKYLHPDNADLEDPKVYKSIFQKGKWAGTFQFTETGAQKLCKQVKPNDIIDISAITSIYRPGPLQANVDKKYVKARRDPSSVEYLTDEMREITESTLGFLIFQEQIASLAHKMGKDISLADGNLLRKALTKKGTGKADKVLAELHPKFIDGCLERGLDNNQAERLWQLMDFFSGYGFNKSHAVSYSVISYQCAWLFTYYPAEWMAAFLDKEPESKKERAISIAKSMGYKIKGLDVNTSGVVWEIAEDNKTLIQPLSSIKGCGEAAIREIVNNRPFETIEDFLFHERVSYSKLNKKNVDALCRSGALDVLMDERFSGGKHFWSAVAVDRPRKQKDLEENIELYRPEGEFTYEEKVENLVELTGVYPLNLVVNDAVLSRLEEKFIPPIAEFDPELGLCWFIPRKKTIKKTKNGKDYLIVEATDSTNQITRIKCWGYNPKRGDVVHVNRPYVARLDFSEDWGFSTRAIRHSFKLIG